MKKKPRTLPSLLKYFEGHSLTIELKTGRTYSGVLKSGDQFMNLVLNSFHRVCNNNTTSSHPPSAVVSSGDSSEGGEKNRSTIEIEDYDLVHIKGSNIRYIHFPPNLDLQLVCKQGLERERKGQERYKRVKRQKR